MLNTNERIIKHKVGLLNLAEELGNVSKACQVMGLSRDTFYRYKDAVEDGGVDALLDTDRRKPNPKNRVEPTVEATVTQYAIDYPAHGQVRVSNELRKQGVLSHPAGFAVSGCVMTWPTSRRVSRPWRPKWPRTV